MAKLIALIVYMLSAVVLVAVTAYLTGIALFGAQPVGGHARRPDHLQHRGDLAVRQPG